METKIFILLVLQALSYVSELTSKTSEEGEAMYLCDNDDCALLLVFVEYLCGESAQISNGNPEIATTMKKSVARRTEPY